LVPAALAIGHAVADRFEGDLLVRRTRELLGRHHGAGVFILSFVAVRLAVTHELERDDPAGDVEAGVPRPAPRLVRSARAVDVPATNRLGADRRVAAHEGEHVDVAPPVQAAVTLWAAVVDVDVPPVAGLSADLFRATERIVARGIARARAMLAVEVDVGVDAAPLLARALAGRTDDVEAVAGERQPEGLDGLPRIRAVTPATEDLRVAVVTAIAGDLEPVPAVVVAVARREREG